MSLKTNILAIAFAAGFAVIGASGANAQEATKTIEIKPGDTLEQIAGQHGTTYVRIFNANEKLTSPDMINAGDTVRIPTASEELPDRFSQYQAALAATVAAATPVAAAAPTTAAPVVAQTATTYTTRNYSSAPVNATSYYVGNGMWCTDWVQSKRADVPIYGNAGYNWISAAQADGKTTGSTAQAGAVAVTDGHVAYVESVNPDGSYVVSEMGWMYQAGNYNQWTVQPGEFGAFIY